jgi:hypothetical protein
MALAPLPAHAASPSAATPGPSQSTATASADTYEYPVVTGDTLIDLQERLLRPGATWRDVQRINGVRNPRRLVPGSTLRIPLALLRQQPLTAEVVHAYGEVTVQRGDAGARRLEGGDTLATGDLVKTGPQSSATLRFGDGSRVLLRADTRLVIERSIALGSDKKRSGLPDGDARVIDTQLRLEAGSADTKVPEAASVDKRNTAAGTSPKSRMNIRTPVANLGVRGTEFRTRADAQSMSVEVLQGRVAAAAASTGKPEADLAVDAGFGTTATPSGVKPPVALLAAPDLSGTPARVERVPLALTWATLPGAARYRARVFSPDAPERVLLEGLFENAQALWTQDLPDGEYRLNVRAADAAGLEGRDAVQAFVLKARPQAPFPNQPAPGAQISDTGVSFGWTRNQQARAYRLQIAPLISAGGGATADFSKPLADTSELEDNQLTVSLPLGSYQWRVASLRGSSQSPDQGPWSDAQTVVRIAPPPPAAAAASTSSVPTALPPTLVNDGMLLRWGETQAASYRVQVARDAAFSQLLVNETTPKAQWLFNRPEGGTYYVRVSTISSAGVAGPFSDTQVIEVPSTRPWWLWLLPALVLLL